MTVLNPHAAVVPGQPRTGLDAGRRHRDFNLCQRTGNLVSHRRFCNA